MLVLVGVIVWGVEKRNERAAFDDVDPARSSVAQLVPVRDAGVYRLLRFQRSIQVCTAYTSYLKAKQVCTAYTSHPQAIQVCTAYLLTPKGNASVYRLPRLQRFKQVCTAYFTSKG